GMPVPECEFWSRVGKTAFGGWDQIDPHEMLALQHRVDRNRYIPSMVAPRLRPAARADLDRYTEVLSKLYRAIGEVAGARGVLDAVFSGATPGPPGMVLRYEALLENPREGLERILAHAGEPVTPESFAFLGDGWVDLGVDHTVAGNPMRFHQGRLDLRLDRAWTTKL